MASRVSGRGDTPPRRRAASAVGPVRGDPTADGVVFSQPCSPHPAGSPSPQIVRLRFADVVAFILAGSCLLAPPGVANAQEGSAAPAAWLSYSGDYGISSRHAVLLDAQARLPELSAPPRQVLLHAGIGYWIGPKVRLAAGYGFRGTRADDMGDSTYLPEHRLWQTIQLSTRIRHLTLAHRMRLEERRMEVTDGFTAAAGPERRWVTAYRLRYQFRGTLPIARTGSEARVYGTASNEVFAVGGGLDGNVALDQNRAALGLGMLATPTLRVEVGYLNQSTITPGLRFAVRTHALQVTVLSTTASPPRAAAPR